MSFFELFMIYAISWWLILFMVLPWGVRVASKPAAGHAASAPVQPRIRRKLLITSLLALLVPLVALGISQAQAAPSIYHAGSNDCAEPANVAPDASINATDSDATIGGSSTADMGVVPTYLDSPATTYNDSDQLDRLGYGVVNVGVATTDTRTGEVRINGAPVGSAATSTKPSHCK